MALPFFIPPALWAASALIVGSAASAAARTILRNNPDLFNSSDRVRLAVLGLQGTGKTTLQNFFRESDQLETGGTVMRGEKVKEVSVTYNNRTIVLLEGIDPSGSPEGLRLHLDEEIKLSDKIFFLIKGDKFLADDNYKKENRALLYSIIRKMNEFEKKEKIWIYVTYKDKIRVKSEEKTKKEILSFLLKNDREELKLNEKIDKIDLVNLTSYPSLNLLKKELFKIS